MGRAHDATMAKDTGLSDPVRDPNGKYKVDVGDRFMFYKDKTYRSGLYVVPPIKNTATGQNFYFPFFIRSITKSSAGSREARLNDRMKSVRIAVEWFFGKTSKMFKFTSDGDSKKFLRQPVGLYLPVAVLLSNLHTFL